jgi:hypothetical protein
MELSNYTSTTALKPCIGDTCIVNRNEVRPYGLFPALGQGGVNVPYEAMHSYVRMIRRAFDDRYTPESGAKADIAGGPSCATSGSLAVVLLQYFVSK